MAWTTSYMLMRLPWISSMARTMRMRFRYCLGGRPVTSLNTLNSSLGYRLEVNVESKTYGVSDPDPISVFYLIAVDAIPEKKLFDDVYYHHTVKDY